MGGCIRALWLRDGRLLGLIAYVTAAFCVIVLMRDMHGAWGILLDDLVSACYAALIMYGLWWAAPKMGLEAWLFTH